MKALGLGHWGRKMRFLTAVIGAAMLAFAIPPASATMRITSDQGGQIGPYLENLASLRSSGERVIIDGPCLSACTLVLGVIPRDHLCVTPRARLGFHTAWRPDPTGRPVVSRDGTQLLMEVYPQPVRKWIARRGGLSPHMMYLSGRELASMYPACQRGENEARN
jgi:hypothetical protein